MTGGSRVNALGPAVYFIAFGAIGLAAGAPISPPSSSPPMRSSSFACPVPVGQQVKAVKAFGEMLPVFRHPRCLNCHGGVDPHSEKHRGVDQLEEGLTLFGDRVRYLAQCQECHDGLPGWMVPPREDLLFVGKSDEELCLQMKHHEKAGHDFVGHIFNDHDSTNVQFIAAGFKGDRAVGEALPDYGLVAEPPPGSQAGLTEKARKWVELLGEEGYTASPECGCVMPKIKLEVHHTQSLEVPRGLPSKEASEVKFQVNLEPAGEDKPGFFLGERSLTRTINMTLPQYCKGEASRRERWQLWALIDSVDGSIKVAQVAFDQLPKGYIECSNNQGKGRIDPLMPLPSPGNSPGFQELLIPADSTSKTVRAGDKTWSESLTITVLEVPR
jgi:hypothetical protein